MTVFPLLLLPLAVAAPPCAAPAAEPVAYTLSFPERGLDDPAAYEGYHTRFFRDAAGNTFQIYRKEREGRVVNLWADAANESVGFTVRDDAGAPAPLAWVSDSICVAAPGVGRSMEYRLRSERPDIRIGHFVLGSMRVERDFQYPRLHLRPFGAPHVLPELRQLVDHLAALPETERRRHLGRLNAAGVAELEARLVPAIRLRSEAGRQVARVQQPAFDGRNRLMLEIAIPDDVGSLELDGHTLVARARAGRQLVLTATVTTDARPLRPLTRDEIFNAGFRAFHDSIRAAHNAALGDGSTPAANTEEPDARVLRFRRLERQVRGLELLSSREKLMAGLPNYATYFGRDMLVTALLMQPIWAPTMNKHVVASVLRKLAPDGQVSHEEALGGQAIRENAGEYNALMARAGADPEERRRLWSRAADVLADLQRVRENYAMVDDEFQFPVLVARYLADPAVPAARKREFMGEPARDDEPETRLTMLLRNLMLVADLTAPYARDPSPLHMVAFPAREPGLYHAASWRDSGAGYGNGRFAMDVNAVWVPQALESTAIILRALRELGYAHADLERASPALRGSTLGGYVREPESLRAAIRTWGGAGDHFRVRLSPDEASAGIARKLAFLPEEEARYWNGVLRRADMPAAGLEFLALSLDAAGEPIAILNTDVATRWFLDDLTAGLIDRPADVRDALGELAAPFEPYPIGLMVERLGPLIANDAYATPDVWAAFERDDYHSPRVVWGREVNLLLLGLMRQIDAAHDRDGRLLRPHLRPWVDALEAALRRTLAAVEASGLQHNEVWSYRIEDGRLLPIRWGGSTDVQLWNMTSLVVDFLLARSESGVR